MTGTRQSWLLVAVPTVALAAACTVFARAVDGGPLILAEIVSAAFIALWAVLLARVLWLGRGLARMLQPVSVPIRLEGVDIRLVRSPARRAFVLGTLRPTIYIGEDLVAMLSPDERRGVLLHEDHHRRTHAPLRSASIAAWTQLVRPLPVVGRILSERLVDLERAADIHALELGVRPASVASALLKLGSLDIDAIAAFSSAADRRIGGLLAAADNEAGPREQLPYEWLPVAVPVLLLALCHLLG
jgi:Zn-dependent protease with chaperone function